MTPTQTFELHKRPDNTSHWVPFFHHQITAAGAPGRGRLQRWPDLGATHVVTLQRHDEMAPWLPEACTEAGLTWLHAPLSGKRLADPNDPNTLQRLITWSHDLRQPTHDTAHIVFHCSAGLHRTGVALYLMLRTTGLDPDAALNVVHTARGLTGHELSRRTRRSGRLVDMAEAFWSHT